MKEVIAKKYSNLLERSFKHDLKLFLFEQFLKEKISVIGEIDYKSFSPDKVLLKKYHKTKQLAKESDLIPDSSIEVGLFDKASEKWLLENKSKINLYKDIYKDNRFIPIQTLESFYNQHQEPSCFYCSITEKEIERLISNNLINTKRLFARGRTLEIDRKDPNGKYDKDNMVFCCYWCNNAKTDEFTHEEFLEMGKKINIIWRERLKKTF